MNILDEIKIFQSHGRIGKYFTAAEVKSVTNNQEANNLSNYAIDNAGSSKQGSLLRKIAYGDSPLAQ